MSENVIAGTVMTRRATYMYGAAAAQGPAGPRRRRARQGHPDPGRPGPDRPDRRHRRDRAPSSTIDGVRIVFQLTPGTEAPAEMNFYFPDHRVLCMAENCTANLHNVYTLRGAQVRDALAWSKYINESIELFGARTDVLFASHHWPRWGNEDSVALTCAQQRDLYRYLHDQTMRLANHGETMLEIAEELALPAVARRRVPRPRLLRHAQPQRQGRLPALPRLVRRQPGQPAPAPAGRGRARATSSTWAAPTRCSRGPAGRSTTATTGGSPRW